MELKKILRMLLVITICNWAPISNAGDRDRKDVDWKYSGGVKKDNKRRGMGASNINGSFRSRKSSKNKFKILCKGPCMLIGGVAALGYFAYSWFSDKENDLLVAPKKFNGSAIDRKRKFLKSVFLKHKKNGVEKQFVSLVKESAKFFFEEVEPVNPRYKKLLTLESLSTEKGVIALLSLRKNDLLVEVRNNPSIDEFLSFTVDYLLRRQSIDPKAETKIEAEPKPDPSEDHGLEAQSKQSV